jgi:hypothetical protein
MSKKDERNYKRSGGWGMVDFDDDYGVVRKGFHRRETTYQSMRERKFKSFRDADTAAGMLDMGSDQYTHVAVQRAYLTKSDEAVEMDSGGWRWLLPVLIVIGIALLVLASGM